MSFAQYIDIKAKINTAVEQMKLVLEKGKSVTLLGDQDHEYADKYTVSEAVTNSSTRAVKIALESLGLSKKLKIDPSKNVILRLAYEESCNFKSKEKKTVPTFEVTTKTRTLFNSTTEVGTVVEEYIWDLNVVVHVFLIYGGEHTPFADVFSKHSQQFELKTKVDDVLRRNITQTFDADITPFVDLEPFSNAAFKINRTDSKCFTPSRNKDTEKFQEAMQQLRGWAQQSSLLVQNQVLQISDTDLASYQQIQLFAPIAPVFDKLEEMQAQNVIYVQAQEKSSESQKAHITTLFKDAKFVPFAVLGLHLRHFEGISNQYLDSIQYIENLIQEQLVAAIGKEITGKDLAEYMTFHNRKLFKQDFAPKCFSIDVRRQGYTPEGNISIESTDKTIITTMSKLYKDPPPVKIALTASTQVLLEGSHHIHGFISYQFSTEATPSYQISARARQFSSFILLIGTVVENDLFDAKHGIIIKNKDDLLIPLLFETIPTAKEFKDAIASLSPEQQRFAKAFRKMQLESTIFSVCLVQIKPQLENVLNLPPGSLTKEIKLTQDLMQLFIDHQIPSDLLKYEGDSNKALFDKINYVKNAAKVLLDMIDEEKKKEMQDLQEMAKLNVQQQPPLAPGGLFGGAPLPTKSAPFSAFGASATPTPSFSFGSSQAIPAPASQAFAPAPPPASVGFGTAPVTRGSFGGFSLFGAAPAPVAKPVAELAIPVQPQRATGDYSQQNQDNWEDLTDYKAIPTKLDAAFEKYTSDSAIRSTIIKVGNYIKRTRKEGFHSTAASENLFADSMKSERSQALDLLDALTRSGELSLSDCEMHVVIAMAQCFDKTLMETIVQDNCNPIEVIERSVLLMAKEVLGHTVKELVNESEISKIKEVSPQLFE
ncbi:hypothetical protein HDV01_000270 [Terramyces sp. JEL0728]|nr:hypothetical protein HDV01_000270 [Terramyces sp. JEL0728]